MRRHLVEIIEDVIEKKSTIFTFNGNNKSHLPPQIGQLVTLKRLELKSNSLSQLPSEIGNLINLHELHLDGNLLNILPKEIKHLKKLELLDLSKNNFKTLPNELFELANLKELRLANNNLTELSLETNKLQNLVSLDLRGNKLRDLSEGICHLKQLQILDLRNNQLRDLPIVITDLNNLKELHLQGNPLPIPEEILANWKDPRKILNYYFQSLGGKPINEAKVVIVGEAGVGKTSLAKRFLFGTFDEKEDKTHGIEIYNNKIIIEDQKIHLRLWDFGGQEIMHSTHQFFFTNRTVYLLVVNARENQNTQRAEYWLTKIKSLAKDSSVIIVGNKLDQTKLEKDSLGRFDPDYALLDKYKEIIRGFYGICCNSRLKEYNNNFEELNKAIFREISHLKDLHKLFPKNWFIIKDQFEEMKEDFISYNEYIHRCESAGITKSIDQDTLLEFLHDLGIVLSFRKDLRLNDTQVRNPLWVTKGVYAIVESQLVKDNNGILTSQMLAVILNSESYPPSKYMFIIDMMKKFELCYEISDSKYLVSGSLPSNQPLILEWANTLDFQYKYETYFGSIISRFIVKMHTKIHNHVWLHGVVLKYQSNEAIIKADPQAQTISISICGESSTRREFLSIIRDAFDEIHTNFMMNIEERIPIPGHSGFYEDYNHLLVLDERGDWGVVPRGLYEEFSVELLLNGVETGDSRRNRKQRRKSINHKVVEITNLVFRRQLKKEIDELEKWESNLRLARTLLDTRADVWANVVCLIIGLLLIIGNICLVYYVFYFKKEIEENWTKFEMFLATLQIVITIALPIIYLRGKKKSSEEGVLFWIKDKTRKLLYWYNNFELKEHERIRRKLKRKIVELDELGTQ